MPLGVTGNTSASGAEESWFDPRRGNWHSLRSLTPESIQVSGFFVFGRCIPLHASWRDDFVRESVVGCKLPLAMLPTRLSHLRPFNRERAALTVRCAPHILLRLLFSTGLVCVASGARAVADVTPALDHVYTVRRVNGSPIPYVARLAATNGSLHTVELDALSLRLRQNGRFDVLVRYRHAAWKREIASGTPVLDAGFHGRYMLASSGALTLYPDSRPGGRPRPPWNGTLSGEQVRFRRAVSMGTQSYDFLFELRYDRSIY